MAKRESTSEAQLPLPKMAKTLIKMGTQTDEFPVTPREVHFRYKLGTTERRVTLRTCADSDVITLLHAYKIVTPK